MGSVLVIIGVAYYGHDHINWKFEGSGLADRRRRLSLFPFNQT